MVRTGILRSLLSPVSRLGGAVRLRVRCAAIAYSVSVSEGGTDSFLGFEYFGLITLASREFRVLLAVLPASLRCLRIFGFVCVAWCCDPTFIAYPHGLLSWGTFIGFFRLVWYLVRCFSVAIALFREQFQRQFL